MARADSTTLSPGPAATSRCSPRLIIDSAESGSPWLPETNTSAREANASSVPGRAVAAELEQPEVERRLGVVDHAAAEEGDRPSRRGGEGGDRLDPRHRRREAGDEHASARAGEHLLEGGDHGVLAGRVPGLLDLVLSDRAPARRGRPTSASVRAGGARGSILKSPLASTTPAGVSIASARLSTTLCATRIGCTRKGPISTGSPGRSVRNSARTPRSCSRRRA
jgi:hypothetical protein